MRNFCSPHLKWQTVYKNEVSIARHFFNKACLQCSFFMWIRALFMLLFLIYQFVTCIHALIKTIFLLQKIWNNSPIYLHINIQNKQSEPENRSKASCKKLLCVSLPASQVLAIQTQKSPFMFWKMCPTLTEQDFRGRVQPKLCSSLFRLSLQVRGHLKRFRLSVKPQ